MRSAGYARIQQHEIEPADFNALIERSGGKGIGDPRKCGAHQLARVVIAGNADKRQLQRRQQALEIFILLSHRRIGQIARDYDEVGLWRECIQGRYAAFKRACRVDASVSRHAR